MMIFGFQRPFLLHSGFDQTLWYQNYGLSLRKLSTNPPGLGFEKSAFSAEEKENMFVKKDSWLGLI